MKKYQSYRNDGFAVPSLRSRMISLAVTLILAFCATRSVAFTTENLVADPSAEKRSSLWIRDGYKIRVVKGPFSSRKICTRWGEYFWYGGDDNSYSETHQWVDVSQYAADIDDGNVYATLGAWFNSWGGKDEAGLSMRFCWGDKSTIQDYSSPRYTHTSWTEHSIEAPVPPGTRKIVVWLKFWRRSGSNNDGYIDYVYLKLRSGNLQVTSGAQLGFDAYQGTNPSASQYNESNTQPFSFRYTGAPGTQLKWTLNSRSDQFFTILDENVHGLIGFLTSGRGQAELTGDSHTGQEALRVIATGSDRQKHNPYMPGWAFRIMETPAKPWEFRYITFAWRKDGGQGIQLQLHGVPGGWNHRYHAGTPLFSPSTEVSGTTPQDWETHTLDLFADWGKFTLTGIAFTAVDGTAGFWDYVILHKSGTPPDPSWIRFSPSGGTLDPNIDEEVTVWLDVSASAPSSYTGTITLNSTDGGTNISVSANVYPVGSAPRLAAPSPRQNGFVNVPISKSVNFKVQAVASYPDATPVKYLWQKATVGDLPTHAFESTTGPEKNYTFHDASDYTIYCKWIDSNGVESDLLAIPIRTWNRPVVRDNPPANFIPQDEDSDDIFSASEMEGKASWLDSRYVGLVGQSVNLMGDADLEGNEAIEKYIWDFDNNWSTIELEQPAGQLAIYTWSDSNLSGRIGCKAISNYGIESDERLFDLRIYDSLQVDPDGPYTGRPNRQAELMGSVNKTSYPGASFEYQWSVKTNGEFAEVNTSIDGRAKYAWATEGDYHVRFEATVTTSEKLLLIGSEDTIVTVEAGKPTAMPGGPYSGGIAGGNFSPVQFEGNPPDFIEADDIGAIQDWLWFFPDRTNMALQFDGEDDYVQAPAMEERTVEMWIKPMGKIPHTPGRNAPAQMGLYSGDADYNVFIYEPDGIGGESDFDVTYGLYVDFYGNAIAIPFNDIKDGWHHVAISWDGETDLRIGIDSQFPEGYVRDGASWVKNRQSFTLTETLQPDPSAMTLIGRTTFSAWNTGSQHFSGIIDEVAVWTSALTGEETRDHMEKGLLGGNDPGLVLYLNFEEGEGDVAHDLSSSGNHATLTGMEQESWVADGHPEVVHGWNPTHAYPKAGRYAASLRVLSEYGKWGWAETVQVKVIDGKITGYVRAADLRTPVEKARLTLTSSHVDTAILSAIAVSDPLLDTTVLSKGKLAIYAETGKNGYYAFEHIPLGSYRISAYKEDGALHEFEINPKITELTLDAPDQLAVDFVDLSVFPIGGRMAYSIQKNGVDVLVKDVVVKAQAIGSTNTVESLPSTASGDATGGNYSLPLFSGKYLFVAYRQGHDIRVREDIPGYDSATGLINIDRARTDIDFIDHTTRELTVFVEDSGKYRVPNRDVIITGDNGQAEGKSDQQDGKFAATLPPGIYTVTVPGADPETEEVDITGGDRAITMTIPVKIQVSISPKPKLFDVPDEFLAQFGIQPDQNPEGYMYYYPPEPRTHTYTVAATANGNLVEDFTLFVTDEVSMMTEDPPTEQEMFVDGEEGEYTITAGLPKLNRDVDPPLAALKRVTFRAEKDGYLDSDPVEDEVIVLGDVALGSAQRIVSVPVVNYTVLHDPPGDGSYSYLDDSITIKGVVGGMKISASDGTEIPVYPSPWRDERTIKGYSFEKNSEKSGPGTSSSDLESKGLIGYDYRDTASVGTPFTIMVAVESTTAGLFVAMGPVGYAFMLTKVIMQGMDWADLPIEKQYGVQYEISPNRHLETASGDELPDLLGPGKGDIYFGEGWTLGLQSKYRLGIRLVNDQWMLATDQIETYDILDRTNQYIYSIRDIENIIGDLEATIPQVTDDKEKRKLKDAKSTWEDLLDKNLAYVWNRDYVSPGGQHFGKSFEDFKKADGKKLSDDPSETLIFSAGPTFEYSRRISQGTGVTWSESISIGTSAEFSHELEISTGFSFFGHGPTVKLTSGASASVSTDESFEREKESSQEAEQSVGFVLNDDDIGDNISARVYADPVWGTPLFFQDPGSVTSDPWEPGTNKGIDVNLELAEGTVSSGPFDYNDGAHYKVRATYAGMRELETDEFDFELLVPPTDNPDNTYVEFNGYWGPYPMELAKGQETAIVAVSVFPPKQDMGNSEEKEYSLAIQVKESADDQISRSLELKVKFADLSAPRATIVAPYAGQRISPVLFPESDPFDIQVVSRDADLASIQLQIRTKQPDSVWEPWRNLSGMTWKDEMVWEEWVNNPDVVTVFDRLDKEPPRREFTFKWAENEIKSLGVGEYALRAVASDKATHWVIVEGEQQLELAPNTDMDPPDVVFLVDDSKPTVLTTLPDYQARESQRIYRGELSAIFTDDMRADDFSDRTFVVTDLLKGSEKVAGFVSYSPALRKAVFVPIVPFQPNGFYRVEIKTDTEEAGVIQRGVHDLAGNPLDNAFMWTFRTTDAPFEPTWSITLRATDGISTDANNIAAVEYGAEDGEDERDARAVPSLTFQLRMSFLDRDKVEFDRDVHPADGRLSHHWFFAVVNAVNGSEVAIYYKPSIKLIRTERQYQVLRLIEFDADGNVPNTIPLDPAQAPIDPDTGEIGEMKAYTYTNAGEASRYFRLDVQKANLVATEFQKGSSGWRFFSAPITPQRADPFVNLGDDIDPFQMYGYDTRNSAYNIYPLDIGEVSLQTGHGYFTQLDDDVEVDVGGASNLQDVTLELEAAGWHAIGNPFVLPVNVAELEVNGQSFDDAVAAELIEGTLYRWKIDADPVTYPDAYEEVTNASQLSPWDGCWLKTKQANLTLTIPAPADIANAQIDLPDSFDPPMAPPAPSPSPVSQSQFDLRLELVSSFSADMTTALGTRRDAQVDRDAFDQSEPPTLSKTVAVYFDHSDWGSSSGLYNTDYQPILRVGEERTWKFTVYTDRPDAEMTLSWEKSIAQVPGDVMLYFRRANGQSDWQDMREVRSAALVSHTLATRMPFEVRAQRFQMSPPSDVCVIAGEKQVNLRWKVDDNDFIDSYAITRQNGPMEDWMLDTGCWILNAGYTPSLTGGSSSSDSGMGVKINTPKGDGRSSSRYVLQQIPGNPVSEFVDTDVLEEATYTYQVSVSFRSGAELRSELFTVRTLPVIKRTALLQSYPNPFNPDVWIPYELAEETPISIQIYNTSGQLVRVLDLGVQPRGRYISKEKAAYWDGHTQMGERAVSGVYFYVLRAGTRFTAAKKMVILK